MWVQLHCRRLCFILVVRKPHVLLIRGIKQPYDILFLHHYVCVLFLWMHMGIILI